MRGSATFDPTGAYRYLLSRRWGPGKRIAFILLNPHRADARRNDPTIRRCIGFARAWGFGSLEVVNLFAYRARHPRELREVADPVGPHNDRHVARAARRADLIVSGWGGQPWAGERARAVRPAFGRRPLYCLGRTRSGAPRHPLYLRSSTPLVRYWSGEGLASASLPPRLQQTQGQGPLRAKRARRARTTAWRGAGRRPQPMHDDERRLEERSDYRSS